MFFYPLLFENNCNKDNFSNIISQLNSSYMRGVSFSIIATYIKSQVSFRKHVTNSVICPL